jgi:hypothetical protein
MKNLRLTPSSAAWSRTFEKRDQLNLGGFLLCKFPIFQQDELFYHDIS